jgi:Taurine catabolism dioxygenase TauD, TfdA family
MAGVDSRACELRDVGFTWIRARMAPASAFAAAQGVIDARCAVGDCGRVRLVGDFVLPPLDGAPSRDFQSLHFDFGVALDATAPGDVARFTALHVPSAVEDVRAVTRLVPLRALLSQRAWCSRPELLKRLASYGLTHGAFENAAGYVEGSLARIVEAAAGHPPVLPSVKANPEFLCGMEFDNLAAELRFFEAHALRTAEVEVEVPLAPGELLIFDNVAVAHGRRGVRRPGELRQWVFGHRRLGVAAQHELRDLVLAAFAPTPVSVTTLVGNP